MSGRRHHYLPRFLQRHFAFRSRGKHFYVYAHHRSRGTYPTNVMEIGQELDFYGTPDNSVLDDKITYGERALAIILHRLVRGEDVETREIARLISALSIRTKAMRRALIALMPPLLEAARARILTGRKTRQQLRDSLSDRSQARKLLDEHIRVEHPHLNREGRGRMLALMLPRWRSFVIEHEAQLLADMQELTNSVFDKLLIEAESIAQTAFLESLSRDPETPKRAEILTSSMTFDVIEATNDEYFVLGDCGVVALFDDDVPRLALGSLNGGVQMTNVLLPISPRKCLVGSRVPGHLSLDPSRINRLSASLSLEFVISHMAAAPELEEIRECIGVLEPIERPDSILRALIDE